jgi:hypothetical protein
VADIIIDLTKLREAQAAADATAHLHEILCIAAEATATRALNAEGRILLAAGAARAALGRGCGVSYTSE